MRCALISDVHSNKYALAAVLRSIKRCGVDAVINAGDSFGYCPWACEVFELLEPLNAHTVLGNHDALVRAASRPAPLPAYWDAIADNQRTLPGRAFDWLHRLSPTLRVELDGQAVRVVHGTPAEPLTGRLYPDYQGPDPEWFPPEGEVLVLGHTHYPLVRRMPGGGLLLNPGSVGQPRDGDPRASWVLFDTVGLRAQLARVDYDRLRAMRELRARGWPDRSVRALDKTRKGLLA